MIDLTDVKGIDEEGIWLYFRSNNQCVDLRQFGSICIHLSELVDELAARLAPGIGLTITLHEVEPGSLKVLVKFAKRVGGFLESPEGVGSMLIGTLFYILGTLTNSDNITIIQIPDGVSEIEINGSKIKVRSADIDQANRVRENADVLLKTKKMVDAVSKSTETTGFGLYQQDQSGDSTTVLFDDHQFGIMNDAIDVDLGEIGETSERVHTNAILEIIKAILQKRTRRWQFRWMNRYISAPILDGAFYEKMYSHEIELGPGDTIEADLRIHQRYDPETGTFTPTKYEVVKVYNYNGYDAGQNEIV